MSNYATLKAAIQSAVYTNGNNEITGAGLQSALLQIVNTVGEGYVFAGVATTGTAPGTPDANVFYIAPAGTYTNFGSSYTVNAGEIGIFSYNGSWSRTKIVIAEIEDSLSSSATDKALSANQGKELSGMVVNMGITDNATINSYIKEMYVPDANKVVTLIELSIAQLQSSGSYAGKYLTMIRVRTSSGNFSIIPPTYFNTEQEAMDAYNSVARMGVVVHGDSVMYMAFSELIPVAGIRATAYPILDIYSELYRWPRIYNYIYPSASAITELQNRVRLVESGADIVVNEELVVTNPYAYVDGESFSRGQTYDVNVTLASVRDADTTIYIRCYPDGATNTVATLIVPAGQMSIQYRFVSLHTLPHTVIVVNNGNTAFTANIIVTRRARMVLKVLYVGSSFGVNTISAFPVLAHKAGVDITCGSLYHGSASIGLVNVRPNAHIPSLFSANKDFGWYKKFTNGKWDSGIGDVGFRTFKNALNDEHWDIIIFQRGAEELKTTVPWSDMQTSCLQQMIEYVRKNCLYEQPEILFCDGIANPVGYNGTQTRQTQIAQTEHIVETAQQMRTIFGIDVIPVGVALQNARNTTLAQFGYHNGDTANPGDLASDNQHLDAGIGYYVTGATLFEHILRKRFGISIINLWYLPKVSDVEDCWVRTSSVPASDMFSGMSINNINLAKLAVLDAIATPTMISETIGRRYGYEYGVTLSLQGCVSSFENSRCGATFFTLLTPDNGLTINSVSVLMGGIDITGDVCSAVSYDNVTYYAISIPSVDSDLIITAVAS